MSRVFRLWKVIKSDRDEYLVWLWELCWPEIAHADQWAEPSLPRIVERYGVLTPTTSSERSKRALRSVMYDVSSGTAVTTRWINCPEVALEVGKKAKAREAQSNMLALFEKRGVIPEVIEAIEERAKQLQ